MIRIAGAVVLSALCIIALARAEHPTSPVADTEALQAAVAQSLEQATEKVQTQVSTSSAPHRHEIPSAPETTAISQNAMAARDSATNTPSRNADTVVERMVDPYPFPEKTIAEINTMARSAIVNILCEPRGGGSLRPTSGSGVIIDPRGIILTNAHVAQYVLLSESPDINMICTVRTGSPAVNRWYPRVVAIPPIWVEKHVHELNSTRSTGTGEHDWALLRIASSTNGSSLPDAFPYVAYDTRDGISFPGDTVLEAGYPAEFIGGALIQSSLHAASSVTTVQELLTFHGKSIDVLSLGGSIQAQGGSSGGPVVNTWGRLVGVITTTSAGTSTADRDLRAITIGYINRDAAAQFGETLPSLLSHSPSELDHEFTYTLAPGLIAQYLTRIK